MTRDKSSIESIAALCQITELLDSHPYDLSGGEQQRAALVKVLLTNDSRKSLLVNFGELTIVVEQIVHDHQCKRCIRVHPC